MCVCAYVSNRNLVLQAPSLTRSLCAPLAPTPYCDAGASSSLSLSHSVTAHCVRVCVCALQRRSAFRGQSQCLCAVVYGLTHTGSACSHAHDDRYDLLCMHAASSFALAILSSSSSACLSQYCLFVVSEGVRVCVYMYRECARDVHCRA